MKQSFSILFVSFFVVILFAACSSKNESYSTPSITLTYFICDPVFDESGNLTGGSDTLGWEYDEANDTYILDTLLFTDSTHVVFAAGFRSYDNNLVSTAVEYDTAQLSLHLGLTSEILAATTAPTDTAKGILYFNLGFNYVGYPVTYMPRTRGNLPITIKVESDAGTPYSPASIRLVQPVK